MTSSVYMRQTLGFETVARRDANRIQVTDLESYKVARRVITNYEDELFGNLMLEDDEVKEYTACIEIIKKKIDEFIKNNPEYGI